MPRLAEINLDRPAAERGPLRLQIGRVPCSAPIVNFESALPLAFRHDFEMTVAQLDLPNEAASLVELACNQPPQKISMVSCYVFTLSNPRAVAATSRLPYCCASTDMLTALQSDAPGVPAKVAGATGPCIVSVIGLIVGTLLTTFRVLSMKLTARPCQSQSAPGM